MNAIPKNRIPKLMYDMRLLIKAICVGIVMLLGWSSAVSNVKEAPPSYSLEFEKAVEVIKKYEGLHKSKGNLVGYGHKILPGEPFKYNQSLSETQADKLLRADLKKLCEKYREFGKDSLLLSALAYNCGIGTVSRSTLLKKIKSGSRDLETSYVSHNKYRGKTLGQLKRRRAEEFELLFVP